MSLPGVALALGHVSHSVHDPDVPALLTTSPTLASLPNGAYGTVSSAKYIPVGVSFHDSWWYQGYGLAQGEEFYRNPDLRVEIRTRMQRLLYEHFGDLGMGSPDPQPDTWVDMGIVVVPALFGCQVAFRDDSPPWALPLNLSDEEVERLEVPTIQDRWPVTMMLEQAEYLRKKYGRAGIGINWQGALNVALKLRGEQLFVDFYEKPALAHRLLDVVAKTLVEVIRFANRTEGGFPPDLYVTSNCSVAMISNRTYEEFVLPYDNYVAEHCRPFGIHHCGVADPVLSGYAKVKNLAFLEAGWGSDIAKARKQFPDLRINARMGVVHLLQSSRDTVVESMRRLITNGHPLDTFSVSVVGVEHGTPDENIRAMFEAAREYGRLDDPTASGPRAAAPLSE